MDDMYSAALKVIAAKDEEIKWLREVKEVLDNAIFKQNSEIVKLTAERDTLRKDLELATALGHRIGADAEGREKEIERLRQALTHTEANRDNLREAAEKAMSYLRIEASVGGYYTTDKDWQAYVGWFLRDD
jgi:predicted RNase H-like nuclease (RuvC/YqgF family)